MEPLQLCYIQQFLEYSQGACEEVPHGYKGKIELFTILQVFCNEGQTTILVEMWEKMSEKLNLWKDEEMKR
jgi:hypothetical protein